MSKHIAIRIDGKSAYKGSELSGGGPFEPYMSFRQVESKDEALLKFVKQLQESGEIYVDRCNTQQLFKVLSAWKCKVWVAFGRNNEHVGYIRIQPKANIISEHRVLTPQIEYQMLCEWVLFSGGQEVTVSTAP